MQAKSFLIGLQFDAVISSYLIVIPFVISTLGFIFNKIANLTSKISFSFIVLLYSTSFLVCAADIPYFGQFYSRFTIAAFQWADSPTFVAQMILKDKRHWIFIFLAAVSILVFCKISFVAWHRKLSKSTRPKRIVSAGVILLISALLTLCMRGRTSAKSFIRAGTAYYCNDQMLNQLGLNPVFTLAESTRNYLEHGNQLMQFMDDSVAISNVQKQLNIIKPALQSPISREVHYSEKRHPYNVIIVIMESMSMYKVGQKNRNYSLTPFLDSLLLQGDFYANAYSCGIHTYNGIFSTLHGYPTLGQQHPMKGIPIKTFKGIKSSLDTYDYSSIFFTTHDSQFDNMEGFFLANGWDDVISSADYPSSVKQTIMGVPDDYLFAYSIQELNKLHHKNKPFLAALMTGSDHTPFYVPPYFKPKSEQIEDQIVEFADYSLSKFIHSAQKEEWFDSTLFVFVADHGTRQSTTYTMPLSYHHIPLLFYAPAILDNPQIYSKMASQLDIYPTIMGKLKAPYTNESLGIDLANENRRYAYFYGEYKYGVIDSTDFMIASEVGWRALYKYRDNSLLDYYKDATPTVEKMDSFARFGMQTFQYLQQNNLQ